MIMGDHGVTMAARMRRVGGVGGVARIVGWAIGNPVEEFIPQTGIVRDDQGNFVRIIEKPATSVI